MNTEMVLPCIVIFLFGVVIGSFLNVCIYRIPRKESIVITPSHCTTCGKRLSPLELIPLFSWLFLRGKCRGCGSRISAQYPLVEAANGILWVLLFIFSGFVPVTAVYMLTASALLVISVIDWRTYEIPDGIQIFILILAAAATALDYSEWLTHLIGFFAVSLPLYLIYLITKGRGIGGGDIKLLAVCGLMLGWKLILLAFMLGALAASIIHPLRMLISKSGRVLALGPYLAFGIFVTMLFGNRLIGLYLSLFI